MSTPTKTNGNKRPRRAESVENAETETASTQMLECLMSKLLSLQDGSSSTSRDAQLKQLEQDKALVSSLKASLLQVEQRLEKKEVQIHQTYSTFNHKLDQGVRDLIVSFLDEEGFWVLEESTVMQLTPTQIQEKWGRLWDNRSFLCDRVFDAANLTLERRGACVCFAQASRMARCMEELAQEHYQTAFPIAATQPGNKLLHTWPTGRCTTLRRDHHDNLFFVRLSYKFDAVKPPLIVEGFPEVEVYDIEPDRPGHSEIVLQFESLNDAIHDCLYQELNHVCDQEFDPSDAEGYEQRTLQAKRNMGNNLAITILELTATSGASSTASDPNDKMELVLSTTGFSYEDGDDLYLKGRSPDFQERGDHHGEVDCIRVGVELEPDGSNLQLKLTG